jgi:hypothetical protein
VVKPNVKCLRDRGPKCAPPLEQVAAALEGVAAARKMIDKLLTPLRNRNRFRHLSIVASNRSSTRKFCNRRSRLAVAPISTNS